MRKTTFAALVALVLASVSMTSCLKDSYESIQGYQYIGDFRDNDTTTIYSDNGLIFKITDRNCGGTLKGLDRVVFVVDILKKTDKDYTYNCKLTGYVGVTVSPALKSSTAGDISQYGNDEVTVHSKWFSAGYINILASVNAKKGNNDMHEFSLILDEVRDDPDGALVFVLKHNANGDVPTEETKDDYIKLGYYLSFTLDGIEYDANTRFKIEWGEEDQTDEQLVPEGHANKAII